MVQTTRLGLGAVLAGFAVATFGMGVYEAWWTIAFAIGGLVVAFAAGRWNSPGRSFAAGAAVAGAIALGLIGAFLTYAALLGPARPCEECLDNGASLIIGGVGSFVVAAILFVVARRLSARRAARASVESGTTDPGSAD